MKKQLHWNFALIMCLVFFVNNGFAQINYTEGFESDTFAWDDNEFYTTEDLVCNGVTSFAGESFTLDGFNIRSTTTALVGTSNGQEVTLSYNYKILDYNSEEAVLNSTNWGNFKVLYASNSSGPWTTLETITPGNHTESNTCALRTLMFTPPAAALYLRFIVTANPAIDETDILLYIDDITVAQPASEACAGTPDTSATVAVSAGICNTAMASLSLNPAYTAIGLTFQWQTSTDNLTFTDVATNGTGSTYGAAQTEATYYRAVITCTASGESVNSASVQVVNTGLDCPCALEFTAGIEPISRVVFAGIDNASSEEVNGSAGQENFTNIPPAQVMLGQTYPIAIEGNTDGDFENFITVLIDFNQNGDFTDEGEAFEVDNIENSTGLDGQQATGTIVIPATALTGLTNMRVLKLYDGFSENGCTDEDGSGFGYGQGEDYLVDISEFVAGVEGFNASNFKYYPNPVTNVLNLNYANAITGIEVFNLLGQKVLDKAVNQNNTQIDMTSLTAGTYMVKVMADGTSKTIKVIKQ